MILLLCLKCYDENIETTLPIPNVHPTWPVEKVLRGPGLYFLGLYFLNMAANLAWKWRILALHNFENIFQVFQKACEIEQAVWGKVCVCSIDWLKANEREKSFSWAIAIFVDKHVP